MKKFLKYNRMYSKNSARFFGFYFGGCNSHNIKFTLLKCTVVFKNSHKKKNKIKIATKLCSHYPCLIPVKNTVKPLAVTPISCPWQPLTSFGFMYPEHSK